MKKPFVTAEQLEDIAARYPTPFHLYDAQGIRENARRLKAAFSWNPGYREYFAVKATPTPAILKILQEEGCGCDCSALTAAALRRNPTDKELSGAVTADGLVSSLAGVFGCSPVTSFSQNVGLVAMTGVVNRRAIATGAAVLVLAGFVPVVSLVFASLPEAVLGGCTIMMFGNIIVSGFQMIANAGFSQRNITIAALSLAVGIGFTQMGDIFAIFPELVQSVFADNCVAVVFVVAILASLLLPKDQKVEGPLIVEEGNDSVDAAADALES